MRITSKGQVTIPIELRESVGLLPDTEVSFERDGDGVRIVKAKTKKAKSRGKRIVDHLTGRGSGRLTTDQIMALTRGR